ncbi:MAG: NUDIX hydrolase [Mediterranea sp.]|jgi:ADP-ribose pyrophosphatase YjhB (NUDIX family)|nr:NUDIX hydrolase [Mediterranea sp.]
MQNTLHNQPLANNHISVDCVVLGFDGEQLKVLLLKRMGEEHGEVFHDMKLPGSLIYMDEDLDEAAARVLNELTGMKNVNLVQFKAFGSNNRTKDPKDVHWLERAMKQKVERIVTVAYLSLIKIDRALGKGLEDYQARWVSLHELQSLTLAFDHNLIIREALTYVRQHVEFNQSALFDLLPRKFTAAQLRSLYEVIYGRRIDVRNFHKKIAMMEYIVPLEEKEQGVAHRAARYYRFDKKLYNKQRVKRNG